MSQIFQEFKFIQGFIGGYIYRPRAGILAMDMPRVYKENKLLELGDILIKTYKSGSLNFTNMIDLSICFQEAIIIIRETGNNTFVFLLIDPSANMNLFNMTLSVLTDDIAKMDVPEKTKVPEAPVEPKVQSKSDNAGPKVSSTEILNNGPLSDILRKVQNALAEVTGPIAKVILIDAIGKWVKTNSPEEEALPALADILYDEINDPEKADELKAHLAGIISSE